MTQGTRIQTDASGLNKEQPAHSVPLTVFLCSLNVLAFEIALTRTYSVLFRSPYVFLVVSIAIGGIGLGAMAAAFLRPLTEDRLFAGRIARLSLLQSVTLTAAVLLLFASPLAPHLGSQGETWAVMLIPLLPFLLAGMLLASVFSRYAQSGGRLYFADLAGAAAACLLTPLLLVGCGGINLVLVLALAAAFTSVLLALTHAVDRRTRLLAGSLCAATALLLLGNVACRWIDLPILRYADADSAHVKPLFRQLADPKAQARMVYTQWTPFARTDVIESAGMRSKSVWTDGDVPSLMEPFAGRLEDVGHLRRFLGFIPYRLHPPAKVLCIGPGGGFDVLLARLGGAAWIDAVEINPSIAVIADRFRRFHGDIYRQPGVTLFIEDGRSFVRRADTRYDLIYLALAKTATTATLGMALGDNYLYTREAFEDYFSHLEPDGLLALVLQDKIQIDRAAVTAVAALMCTWQLPPPEIARRLVILQTADSVRPNVGPYRYLLLLRATPFPEAELAALPELARAAGLAPVFVPAAVGSPPYTVLADPAASLGEITAAFNGAYPKVEGKALDLSPVSDDRPFYADFSRWLHPQLALLLLGTAVFSLLFVGAIAWWLRRLRVVHSTTTAPAARLPIGGLLAYAAALGIGFMIIEVVLIQRLILFLGYPTRTLSVIVFALLLAGSLGSLWSQRWPVAELGTRVRTVAVLLALGVSLFALGGPRLLELFLPLSLNARSLIAGVLVAPVGFLMGIPFPSAIRWLGTRCPAAVPALWGVNGVTSVLGSVAAMSLAKLIGYSATLTVGGAVYLAVAWLAHRSTPEAGNDACTIEVHTSDLRAPETG